MLVIRLSRTGKRNQASYRIVVAEKSAPIKGRFVEILGYYNPSEGKKLVFDQAKVEGWVKKGACPSDAVASLLSMKGVKGLEEFMAPRDKKRAKKNPTEVAAAPAPAAEEAAPAEPVAEEAAPA